MTAGASRAATTITPQPALAPSPQPRSAPTGRALPPELVVQEDQSWTLIVGQCWTPIVGQNWTPIDTGHIYPQGRTRASYSTAGDKSQPIDPGTDHLRPASLAPPRPHRAHSENLPL